MSKTVSIALAGDYNPQVIAHQAIPLSLNIAARANQLNIEYKWLNTIDLIGDVGDILSPFQGLWCVPASPYENFDGVMSAIRHVRENNIPFLGTCGGYQHAVLEFARHVLNLPDADNCEVNPGTNFPLISPLSCSLIDESSDIVLTEDTFIQRIYKSRKITEQYHCSYGVNRNYQDLFADSDLVISGFDLDADPRCVELNNHPFFIATAYQPERAALDGNNHPLINQFILSILYKTHGTE